MKKTMYFANFNAPPIEVEVVSELNENNKTLTNGFRTFENVVRAENHNVNELPAGHLAFFTEEEVEEKEDEPEL